MFKRDWKPLLYGLEEVASLKLCTRIVLSVGVFLATLQALETYAPLHVKGGFV
jgi:hypothetical protein